jgi:hypothetical protein
MLAVVFKQVRDGPDQSVHQPFLALFKTLCELHWHASHEKTRALAREFLHDWEAIWTILEQPDLPATNNAAEVRFVDPKPSSAGAWGMGPEPKGGDNCWLENLIPV